jgi:alkanesulfonate monooxygenase SsuD/methylene tetrahydromethanopterin reductase-like flavin-dependent oxidoreductase (luciferase family)
MRVYHFSEEPYPEAWSLDRPTLRVTLPNKLCRPQLAHDLYHRYIDEWALADEIGLDIMVNEHHQTATCITSSASVMLGILSRITKKARLLILGVPIANRSDPVRIAEELAMVDVISGGRLEMGFVKGIPYEITPANSSPLRFMDRFWEAHDIIIQAMTTQDGPFNFEGEFFHHRNVNIWPRPMQEPHPPVWITTGSPGNARDLGRRGYVMGSFLGGFGATTELHKAYAEGWRAAGRGDQVPVDRFGYLALAACGSTDEEARRRAEPIIDYVRTTAQVASPFKTPPGYFPVDGLVRMLRTPVSNPRAIRPLQSPSGRMIQPITATADDLTDIGLLFCGTPDTVFKQIIRFTDGIGGLGNLMLMMQGGDLGHADTSDSLKLFAKEVLPRLKDRYAGRPVFQAAA